MLQLETISIIKHEKIAEIIFNRPEKANAINQKMWFELQKAFEWLDSTSSVRVGILAGWGKHFTAGIDFSCLSEMKAGIMNLPEGQKQEALKKIIQAFQACVSAIENCRKPVIAAIDGACLGGGIDIITACDMRYSTKNARFSVKEIDLAIVADLGTLQRLPHIVGQGIARELAYTGREFNAPEALDMGLINKIFADQAEMKDAIWELAQLIAQKSPLTIRAIKDVMNYSRDHSVSAGLDYTATKNASLLLSKDIEEAIMAIIQKRTANFAD